MKCIVDIILETDGPTVGLWELFSSDWSCQAQTNVDL